MWGELQDHVHRKLAFDGERPLLVMVVVPMMDIHGQKVARRY